MDQLTADLLTRIEALEAQLAMQAAEIAAFKALQRASSSAIVDGPVAVPAVRAEGADVSRRDWLLKGAAGLAVTALASSRAEAASRTTVLTGTGSTDNYGLAAAGGAGGGTAGDPATFLPALGAQFYGAIGTITALAAVPPANAGLWGAANASDGVLGTSNTGTGVHGRSTSGTPLLGDVPATSSANTIAIYGLNNSTYAGPSQGAGGFGVYGLSARGHGLVGATAAAGGAAVVGATNGVAGAYAAAFYGPVVVSGDFVVVGGAKSAAVPFPDGTHRQLYCVESPESWFEDFGTAELRDGCAEVAIDAGFSAVAETEHYHVFLAAHDRDHHLYVAKRTPKGFTVAADSALAALKGRARTELTGTFSWRVVARRKDIPGRRLAVVSIPPQPILPSTVTPSPTTPSTEDAPVSRSGRRGDRRNERRQEK